MLGLHSVHASAAESGGPGQVKPRLLSLPSLRGSLLLQRALKITGSLPRF